MLRYTNNQNKKSLNIEQVSQILRQDKALRQNKVKAAFKIPKDTSQNLKAALKAFLKGQTLISGNYVATQNALVYRSVSVVDQFSQDVLCIRLIQDGKTFYIGNSSQMTVCGTKVSFGNRTRNWGETEPQRVLTKIGVPMLPFSVFIQAGLKVTQTRILDQSQSETVKREVRKDRKGNAIFADVHYTGASLFQNGTSYFLFDIDRVEIEHGIFNPFLVELSRPVNTIAEAYDSLIPLAVRTAQSEGIPVLRQGEHFFVKVAEPSQYKADLARDSGSADENDSFKTARLSAQGNRDHEASMFNEKSGLVSGFVKHWGREHRDLDLTLGWYKPIPNTAVKAFTITGDID
jgi:hypothetical protein